MKEITVLSGKGGTGKTSITAALASFAKNAILCDNDVDAADLHLILNPTILEKHIFHGAWMAEIQTEKCIKCGLCAENCRFDAIKQTAEGLYEINPILCEGCRLCEKICPSKAIFSQKSSNNYWYVSHTRFGTMVHAHMGPGEENSGKLVTQIRKTAKDIAQEKRAAFIINDGPPGIGCSAIASITGTDTVLVVIEPSKSGWHDAFRLIQLVKKFDIPIYAVINKYDINISFSKEIESALKEQNIPLIAQLPFNEKMVEALIQEKTISELYPEEEISKEIETIWNQISR